MIRHIVFWKFGDKFTEEENKNNALRIKESLEALKEMVPGTVSIEVITETLPSSSGDADVILNSLFNNEEAFHNYQVHPDHIQAGGFIKSVMKDRKCIDYYEA